MLIRKSYLVKNAYKYVCLHTQTCQALMLDMKELAMLFLKTMQEHLGKKLHSSTSPPWPCSPFLPTQVMVDTNFIPSNLFLTVRVSYQQAVRCCQLAKTEGSKSRQRLKGTTPAGCCSSTVLFSAWGYKADTHGAFEYRACMPLQVFY